MSFIRTCGVCGFPSWWHNQCRTPGCRMAAQGLEAGTAETTKIGSVHESPVAESDAPKGGPDDTQ